MSLKPSVNHEIRLSISSSLQRVSAASRLWMWTERFLAVCLLMLSAPVLMVLAVIIKMDSPGPALFRQSRIGRNGQLFTLYKLRTMYRNSDSILAAYLDANPDIEGEWQIYAKMKGYDPRVTRVGRWISQFSLNEIPQLLNVIKGDMSLVGPRPYLPVELPELDDNAEIILSVCPGITWQG